MAGVLLAAGLGLWAMKIARGAKSAAALPRYALTVGQELVYAGTMTQKFSGGAFQFDDVTTLWVLRQNTDGSWRLAVHNVNTTTRTRDGNAPQPEGKRELFDTFDLFPDGRVAGLLNAIQARRALAPFFRLPADAAAARSSWDAAEDGGDKSVYRLLPGTLFGSVPIEKTDRSLLNDVYLAASKSTGVFDPSRGLIVAVDTEYRQGWGGFAGTGSATLKLKSNRLHRPEWIAQLARESEQLTKASEAVGARIAAMRQGAKSAEAITAAEQILQDAQKSASLPVVQQQFAAQLEQLRSSAKYYTEERTRQDAVLNHPSPSWETTDLDGARHALAGYRGQVVVLDFWYRGCGWCIRAMPQIKEVTEHYRGRPVAVLGMNTDRVEEDARFVMKKLELNYPTLKATGLPEKYGVQGFPTLVVIDQGGVVREFHVGYSPTLREQLIRTIDRLLAGGA